ncbi:hypothetical protein R4227_16405 [Gordonia amicalis]|uniref:hypothetical protein n=1 Tax=Gordonia amicalis TaxID=89053 RepID=UPI002952C13B|nr:hypothetical protein [Gordonia amicalis]MDV7101654.1 hypothetical protein [Gordonia amicalis]
MSRLDRTGEPIDDGVCSTQGTRGVDLTDTLFRGSTEKSSPMADHDPRCDGGWLGGRDADHPRPCLQCRPHLRQLADVADCTPEPRPGDPR